MQNRNGSRSRLALVHLVHEARGLDTFPLTLRKIKAYEQHTTGTPPLPAETLSPSTAPGGGTCAVGGADANAAGSDVAMSTSRGCAKGQKNGTGGEGICARTLQMNAHDEVGHVGCAVKWFEYVCKQRRLGLPHEVFKSIVQERFKGDLAPPFNTEMRDQAGMAREYYEWAGEGEAAKRDTKVGKQRVKAVERDMNIMLKTLQAQQRRLERVRSRVTALRSAESG